MATRSCRQCLAVGFLAGVLAAGTPVFGQSPHHPDKGHSLPGHRVAEATSTFRGEYEPATRTIRGLQELEYRNLTPESLTHLMLLIPSYCTFHLDSILLYGVPLDRGDIGQSESRLELQLPMAVPAGQAAVFLISFSEEIAAGSRVKPGESHELWSGWLPRVALQNDKEKLDTCGDLRVVSTRTYVDLTVDSSLRVYAGGELINDKEMYGLLPSQPLVEHIAARGLAADFQTPYVPVFANGRRQYFFRFELDSDCPVLIGAEARVDRIQSDSLTLEIVHPIRVSEITAHRFSEEVLAVIGCLRSHFGPGPPLRVMIFDSDHTVPEITSSAIGFNRSLFPWNRQRADLLAALARWWMFVPGSVGHVEWVDAVKMCGDETSRVIRGLYDPERWPKYRRFGRPALPLTCADSVLLQQAAQQFGK